jgi:predicted RNA polymerase sigma factor
MEFQKTPKPGYAIAKNKLRDFFKRDSLFTKKIAAGLSAQDNAEEQPELDLSEGNIEDGQLKMLFAICNPLLSSEAQVTLSLRVLCGFGINEIASALLSTKSTINKRLLRAKTSLKKTRYKT